jgi:16S rRNA (guanine527-N7)-methyltransferase
VTDAHSEGSTLSGLAEVLVAAREAGFLGPGPIERHLRHAQGFTTLVQRELGPDMVHLLDLGSGGGLPGLVIATERPKVSMVLLEANERRAQFLERAVQQCGLQGRVSVIHERAEIAGRDPLHRASFDGVVVRSFGTPAVVAECAAPFIRLAGRLIVSEPPGDEGAALPEASEGARWPADRLVQFGLEPVESVRGEFGYQILRQGQLCSDRFPRRNGIPAKRPLF